MSTTNRLQNRFSESNFNFSPGYVTKGGELNIIILLNYNLSLEKTFLCEKLHFDDILSLSLFDGN